MSPKSNNPVATALSQVLADTYALQAKTQTYHWNVVGPNFHGLHTLFEEQYNQLFAAVDLIAERIRALGAPAPGGLDVWAKMTKVSAPKEGIGAIDMVKDLMEGHRLLAQQAKEALDIAEKADDQSTADLLTERITEHDKNAWMLASTAA